MRKFAPLFLILFVLNIKVKAQCNAAFSYSANQGFVSFTATSTNPSLSHLWFFGDGSHAYGQFSFYMYNQSGVYTVKHIIYDSLGTTCSDSSTQSVTINIIPLCQASFYSQPDSFFNSLTFISNSNYTGSIQNYIWQVDGQTMHSGGGVPSFRSWLNPGPHTVCLNIVTTSGCTSSYCDTVLIANFCNRNISFTHTPSASNSRTIGFTPSPDLINLKYNWWFGDGYYSAQRLPVHTYSSAGTYSVRLSIYDSIAACIDTVRQNIFVSGASDSCTASFIYTLNNYGVASFTAVSNQVITSQHWAITNSRDSALNANLTAFNPVYQFVDSGYYRVCLRLTTSTGCERSYCDYIYVNNISGQAASSLPSYPNPVSGNIVRINLNMEESTMLYYKVYNLNGNLVYQSQKQGLSGLNVLMIPVQQLNKGQYFVDIIYGEKRKRSMFQKL
jgi:PKD repeat protein